MVSASTFSRHGAHNWLLQDRRKARSAFNALLRGVAGPRRIPNITPSGLIIGDSSETLIEIATCLAESNRLFRQGNVILFMTEGDPGASDCLLRPLAVEGEITKVAAACLSNLIYCQETKVNGTGQTSKVDQPQEYEIQFPVPPSVLQQVFVMDAFKDDIPEARLITKHPVFNQDLMWLDVGYHAGDRILVCGEAFEPASWEPVVRSAPAPQTVQEVLDRLPPTIRRWVEGFHWHKPVDLINYIGAALMIPLIPVLIEDGHPGVNFWANQHNVG